jgi:hypothetical protein
MTSDEIGLTPGKDKTRGLVQFDIQPEEIKLNMEEILPVLRRNKEKIIVRERRNNRRNKSSDLF